MKTYLSPKDVQKLLDSADNLRDLLMVKTLWSTGMRVTELISIKTTDVDPVSNTISILHQKSSSANKPKKHRLVPIHHGLANELLDYMAKAKIKEGERIFPVCRATVRVRMLVMAERAGFSGKVLTHPESMRKHNVSPHRLRDALAVQWMKKQNNMEGAKALQNMLGHSRFESVPGYSPVIVRYNGMLSITPLEDLWEAMPGHVEEHGDMQVKECPALKVYQGTGAIGKSKGDYWSPVTRLLRHEYNGDLLRIVARAAVVDVTPNHSLIGFHNPYPIDACQVKIGDKISIAKIFKYSDKFWGFKDSATFPFVGSNDLAWLYGLFVADGSAGIWGGRYKAQISCYNAEMRVKIKAVIEDNFHISGTIFDGKSQGVQMADRRLAKFFEDNFYTLSSEKRIPESILNAPADVKRAFLDGYLDGDGYRRKNGSFTFDTISPTLAQGLVFILAQLGRNYTVYSYPPKRFAFSFHSPNGKRKLNPYIVRSITSFPYKGFIYDMETESHVFTTGIGPVKVHNTTARYLKLSVDDVRSVYNKVLGES